MASTDIYSSRESKTPSVSKSPRTRHRSSSRRFDEPSKKRRSRNSGFRRFLHLTRKDSNEKIIWILALIFVVILLILAAIWQFWYVPHVKTVVAENQPPAALVTSTSETTE